jgi:predicted ArsR family transcriptional regulator
MDEAQVLAVASLADPTRRRMYDMITRAAASVSRDEVAAALDIGRPLAAFHLDKLADAGLLDVTYARPEGRTGPGAGRPAKLYRSASTEVAVELPPRSYGELSVLLAEALDRAGADLIAAGVARAQGVATGEAIGPADLIDALHDLGYAPVVADDRILLRNCPYSVAANQFPPLICGMNFALLEGVAQGAGWPCAVSLDPAPGRCCVTLASKNN